MAKLIAICGKICCGKSYYARELKEKENAVVLQGDYNKCLKTLASKQYKFDIIFLDPPYATAYGEQAMQLILKLGLLAEDGLLIFEHAKEKPAYDFSGFEMLSQKKYGIKMVSYFKVQHD